MALKLAFMGSPDFAVPALKALIAAGLEIACVYSQPARPAGRGQAEKPCPIEAFAIAHGLPRRTPKTLRNDDEQNLFQALGLDMAVVAAYGLILPKPVLAAPRHGCLNIHASMLPRWRGAAPIQRAILAGDNETGITIMQMEEGLDTGPTLLMESVPITPKTTAESLHDALAALGARLIVDAIAGLAAGEIVPRPQPEEGATYANKLERAEGRLDWQEKAEVLERKVRAFTPWPGAWFDADGERIKVLEAELAAGSGPAGTVLDDHLTIACGAGALRLVSIQRQGKRAMDAASFLRGFKLAPGSLLP